MGVGRGGGGSVRVLGVFELFKASAGFGGGGDQCVINVFRLSKIRPGFSPVSAGGGCEWSAPLCWASRLALLFFFL